MRPQLKYLLIGLALLLGGGEVWRRVTMLAVPDIQPVALTAFAGLFLFCAISLTGFALLRQSWLRWPIAALMAAGSMLVDGYQWAVGDFMDYDGFVTMTQSTGDLGNAIAQQGPVLIWAAAKAIILFFAIGLKPVGAASVATRAASWTALPILLLLTTVLFFRGGEGASGLPTSHSSMSYLSLFGYEYVTADRAPREEVAIARAPDKLTSDIVLIIDESIAGAYLDINSIDGVYSGLLDPKPGVSIHNFGLATSINHCSVGSNVTLRFGGTRDNYRDTIRSKPSIWAYAKQAGLGTIYIDGQRTGGRFQNQMNAQERKLIDQWDQFADVPVQQRDYAVADRLSDYLNDDIPQFILVNKVGAHFPVNDKFPASHATYRPMLKRGQYPDVTDMASDDDIDGGDSSWELYRNSYRNTLTWQVGGFFDRLIADADLTDATLIYTADHGQTFHERGEQGQATHCTPNPAIEEGVVPLVVLGGSADGAESARWAAAAQTGQNQRSHYRIFPTLLGLMGYAAEDVRPVYGVDLFSDEPDPFTFNVRFHARLGSSPSWLHVPVEKIARPPTSDYRKIPGGKSSGDRTK